MQLAPLLARANATKRMQELRKEIDALKSVKDQTYYHQVAIARRLTKLQELKQQFIFKIYDADDH